MGVVVWSTIAGSTVQGAMKGFRSIGSGFWIDETERRTWFLFESSRRGDEPGR
jgi:hypothetical protein